MWMLTGVITLIGMTWYMIRSRREDRWPVTRISTRDFRTGKHLGTPPPGSLYDYRDRRYLAPIQRIGYDAAPQIQVRIKRKRWWDRLFTTVGISVACRTGNPAFDRAFYLVTDAAPVCRALNLCPQTQQQILELKGRCEQQDLRFRQVRIRRGRVWLEVVARKRKLAPRGVDLAQSFVPHLRELSATMDAEIPETALNVKDHFTWKAAAIVGVSSATFFTGIYLLGKEVFVPSTPPLEEQPFIIASLITSAVIVALLVVLTMTWLGRTSRTHLVLMELVFIGSIGFALTSFTLLREANMALDFSAGERHVVQVLEKHSTHGRHSSFFLNLEPWGDLQDVTTLRVGIFLYGKVRSGYPVVIEEHPGALGIRWVRIIPPRFRYVGETADSSSSGTAQ
ncbi:MULTISPECIES: hypothetical protein [unclassified Guyparkeria]|uniref:hypothetical protein n=1 Tax=unclassified Guyparkeria TaxID=2626246 RepID=UPI00073395FF|nr:MULTISPECIES: hypothetical protein [unclassified Guyparkeria]KTG17860.1 hypothetical protein AUR63_07025 [Guyparkeria sp. XI15]OAE89570.1 hypothetical protein AWR35_07035 [Guyparkeria sp. WRN-7]